jgi:hypothetical protein
VKAAEEDPTRGRGVNGSVEKILEDERAKRDVVESAV